MLRYLIPAAIVAYLATGVHQIRPDERAVVRRFGRVAARPGPGLWIGLPWGMDQVERVRVRAIRRLDVGFDPNADDNEMSPAGRFLTGDQNLVSLGLAVDYAVDDRDEALDDHAMNRDAADAVLAREVETAAAEWVAGRPVDEVLLAGRAALPQWLAQRLPGRLDPHRLGFIVQRVSVTHLAPPAEVRDAFDAVTQAQTGIRTAENRAGQQATARSQAAEAMRFRAEQQAEAYRREKLTSAVADAEAFTRRLGQYHKLKATNPDALTAIWWDEMGRTLLGMKGRGRVDLLDAYIGPDGLDVTQFVSPKK